MTTATQPKKGKSTHEAVIGVIGDEWQTTSQISDALRLAGHARSHSVVCRVLNNAVDTGELDRDRRGSTNLFRLAQDAQTPTRPIQITQAANPDEPVKPKRTILPPHTERVSANGRDWFSPSEMDDTSVRYARMKGDKYARMHIRPDYSNPTKKYSEVTRAHVEHMGAERIYG